MARANRRFNGVLDAYAVNRTPWRAADARRGRPAIYGAARDDTRQPVIVKQWQRAAGVDDRELVEIWRDEIRHLYRLASYPGARDRLAMLIESIEEPGGYILVLDGDDRVPLAVLLERETASFWFKAPRQLRNRLRLWQEIKRLVEALDILHGQGLVHRNLDSWSVLTNGGSEPDFILTGFEWSMRLTSSSAGTRAPKQRRKANQPTSFYDDWRALGAVAAQILGLPSRAKPGEPYRPDIRDPAAFLIAAERDLLALLLTADPLKRIDGATIGKAIDDLIATLGNSVVGHQPKLVLATAFGPNSRLAASIREASGDAIGLNEVIGQHRFLERSLEDEPRLVRLKPRIAGDPYRYRLIGRELTYDIEPFINSRSREESWFVARCRSASRERPPFATIDAEIPLDRWTIEFTTIPDADRTFGSYQGRTVRWDQLFPEPPAPDTAEAERTRRTFDALLLVQIVEALVLAADIFPVRIVGTRIRGGDHVVELATRDDPAMTALSDALGLRPPATRLINALNNGQQQNEEWRLAEAASLGLRERDHTSWRFESRRDAGQQGARLVFQGSAPPPSETELFLRVGGPGHDSLVKRRLKALKNLREHGELLAMLSDPAVHVRPSHDPWDTGATSSLDESKSLALEELWSILPLYLIQGPPGVGKTRLVQELVLRRLTGEPTERLLLSAQSHSAVDHLLEKVREALEHSDRVDVDQLLPLRCRPRDRNSGSSSWDVEAQAAAISRRFAASALVKEAPLPLRRGAQELARSNATLPAEDEDLDHGGPHDRAFAALLLRSANLVFASSNAGQLEQLVDERARFDWAIVEEAGKATGVELLAPLLLSHRRLMIGDHKQLPPFNSKEMLELLESPSSIRDAIRKGRSAIVRQFAQLNMEDLLDRVGSDDFDLETTTPRARDLLMLFETFIVNELGEHLTASPRKLARRLEHQHRMHPVIAGLVSSAFYDGAIRTDPSAEANFAAPAPPMRSSDPLILPDAPVLFVNAPYAHATLNMRSPERTPSWTNPSEVQLCCNVLGMLRADPERRPSLTILSPYRAQVRAIENAIEREQRAGLLRNLEDFSQPADGFCQTVDSFQGNEADVVIISLVRNNHHSGAKALGFLSSPKRMNVLVSRARWRLILLGSWDFLQHRFSAEEYVGPAHELYFLRRMLDEIERLSGQRDGEGRPLARIVDAATIGRGL